MYSIMYNLQNVLSFNLNWKILKIINNFYYYYNSNKDINKNCH